MESGLLNAFHDDQYDDTYVKYDVDNNYWSNENTGTIGLQLSETLNGILPTDDNHIYFSDDIETQYSIELQNDLAQDICGIHNEVDIIRNFNNDSVMSSSPSIEIIPVDPNCDYNSPLEEYDIEDESNYNDNNIEDIKLCDKKELRSCSRSTFRSRTDSSSIGDYESHSSDESDFSESDIEYDNRLIYNSNNINKQLIENNKFNSELKNNNYNIVQKNNYDLISGNIETKNFDLTKFITEDDYLTDVLLLPINKTEIKSNGLCKNRNDNDESDVDVDIETINDNDKNNDIKSDLNDININGKKIITQNLLMKNNNNNDPAWTPTPLTKGNSNKGKIVTKNKQRSMGIRKIQSKFSETLTRNQSIAKKSSPQKKQFGIGRGGKNISMCTINKEDDSSDEELTMVKSENNDINEVHTIIIDNKNKNNDIDNKNIAILSNESNTNVICQSYCNMHQPVKRKLNLEEYYKKRRENSLLLNNLKNSSDSSTNLINICNKNIIISSDNTKINTQNVNINEITNNVIILKENELISNNKIIFQQLNNKNIAKDPITEAKNKVLRMQELKRKAAQKRLIDFTISTKVGPVTKILPLEEIVNSKNKLNHNNNKNNDTEYNKLNNEFEEIIVVSVSCNTDIKIPPIIKTNSILSNKINSNLSKSTELLYDISDTIQKVTATDSMKISNSSLITSIQNVVFKKTVVAAKNENNSILKLSKSSTNINKTNQLVDIEKNNIVEQEQIEHGEDKIIMHLPKNRQRKLTKSMSTQTNILPEFPPLEIIYAVNKKVTNYENLKERKYRSKHSTKYSSDDDYDEVNDEENNYKYKSRSRSPRSQNYSDSVIYKQNGGINSTATSSSESSDRDRRRNHDRRNHRIYSTSPSRSERSHSSCSTSSSISNSSNRSRNRWKRRKSRSRSRSTSRSRYRSNRVESRQQTRQPSPAVEERRIVYVGRIEDETSKEDLKRKFLSYGLIKQITLHYKDTGMKYGFVTFEKAEDAFKAIDNGMRDSKINMYDISFGGRRQFCRATYSDLDSVATNSFQAYSYPIPTQNRNIVQDDSFEALLQKMKEKLGATKNSNDSIPSNNVRSTSSTT